MIQYHENEMIGTGDPLQCRTHPARLKFATSQGFLREVRRRVDEYFQENGIKRRDCPKMYWKSAIVLGSLAASYALLLVSAWTWALALPLAVLLGLSMAAVGFNVQHDGGHGSYSERPWLNKVMSTTLDLLGGSSFLWARKHNAIHHTYTNITHHDDDIDMGVLGRFSPHQKRLRFHRFQQYYMWLLYCALPVKWHVFDDFRALLTGRIGEHRVVRPRGWDLALLLAGKAFFYSLAFVIPMLLYPAWVVLLLYGTATFVQGLVLSVVFQLAHCVEEAQFPLPEEESGRMHSDWAVHQVETTVDFARENRLLSWLIGGLNFQVEHHLFPQICHIHYPAIAPTVEATCRDFGLRYLANRTLRAGVTSHFRWLRRMGRAETAPSTSRA